MLMATLLAPRSGLAARVPELLVPARDRFDFGRYAEAIRIVEELVARKVLTSEAELTEAWRIHGLSSLYLGERDEARASFEQLLAINPDYDLDALLVPLIAIELLEDVREAKREFLEPIRARRRKLAAQQAEEEREREQRRQARAASRGSTTTARQPVMIQRVERHPFFLNFLPLGAAQLAQKRNGAGVIFAVGQSLAVAGTIITWSQVNSRIEPDGRVEPGNLEAARSWRQANWALFGTSLAIYLGGVIDAIIAYEEETVSLEVQSLAETGSRSADGGGQRQFFITPVAGGGAAGILGTF
jgi:tetratricopeptide (TPR) repeat protein